MVILIKFVHQESQTTMTKFYYLNEDLFVKYYIQYHSTKEI